MALNPDPYCLSEAEHRAIFDSENGRAIMNNIIKFGARRRRRRYAN
jgi:hypothetical protein